MAGLMQQELGVAVNCSAASWLGRIPEVKKVEEALSPSYDDLPYELKLLSLYMSMFPQGYIINKHRLIRKWKAEGLIATHTSRGFDDIAEEYFSELIQRDVIRPLTCKHSPQVGSISYEVNDFVLQFLVSRSEEKNFATTSRTLINSGGATVGKTQMRRVFLHQPVPKLPMLLEKMDLPHTRSLTVSGAVSQIDVEMFIHLVVLDLEGWDDLKDAYLLQICSSGKLFLLRYLSIRNTQVSELPTQISMLSSLETLDISHTQIKELPSQVCVLRALEELDLRSTRIRHLPEQIVDLAKLRHLLVGSDGVHSDETVTKIPDGIDRATHLETLATVDLSECSASFVSALADLRYLEVLVLKWSFHHCTNEAYQKALWFLIARSGCLKSLTIHCELGCSMEYLDSLPNKTTALQNLVITARFLTVPKWIQGLSKLASLQIRVCKLAPDDLEILGRLSSLKYLSLGLDFLPKEAIVIGSNKDSKQFIELQQFSVECRVPWLTFRVGAMPKLTDLELRISTGPASQQSVPSGIGNLFSLEQITVRYDPWYINSRSVRVAIDALRGQVADLEYTVMLVNNGVEEDVESILAEAASRESKITPSETGHDEHVAC